MACLTNALRKKTKILFTLLLGFVLSLTTTSLFAEKNWQQLAPGIDYRDLTGGFLSPWSHVHVFRISPKSNSFNIIMAKDFSKKLASVQEFAQKAQALLAINGGFFDYQHNPLGLRISEFQQKNPLKTISWWGVFFIKNQKPYIKSFRDFKPNSNIEFAIQSGPRLLIQGEIASLKPGIAERSALGITQDKQIILLVTENAALTTTELAKLMREPPLACTDALNLDGGSSTQMFAEINKFSRHIYGFSHVSDAVVIKSRT